MKLTTILLLTIITIYIQGCVGLGGITLTDITETIEQPLLFSSKGQISNEYKASRTADAATVREYWGAPDSVRELAPGRYRWDYNFGLRWNGLGLLIIFVPVPLALPLGHDNVSLEFEGDRIVSAMIKQWNISALAYCGFFVMAPGGWVCGATTYSHSTTFVHPLGIDPLLPRQSFDKDSRGKGNQIPKTEAH